MHESAKNGSKDDAQTPAGGSSGEEKPLYLWNNPVTLFGLFLAVLSIILILTYALFTLVSPAANPYVDIIGFMVLPGMLLIALLIMPVGLHFRRAKLRRENPDLSVRLRFPKVDLADPVQRRVAKVFVVGTFVFLPVLGVSGYHGYHYTDSTEFCAEVCHAVMEPEGTTHKESAHARVTCAECHIGAGAEWFVKAKISGIRQVFATFRDTYHRPIHPAITQLRPARDTCEQCHWPEKFFGAQLREISHFSYDEENTRHDVKMLVLTGGANRETGRAEGIHSHMALGGELEYVAIDDELQRIPWVRLNKDDGTQIVYRSDGLPHDAPPPQGVRRVMDCMDCHNRPAHKFLSPDAAINSLLDPDVARIDATLPFIKRESVKALTREYPDTETAEKEIASAIRDFYEKNYPEMLEQRRSTVQTAIAEVQGVYRQNFFPHMRVNWQTYPDNIGHFVSPGCYRCHEGDHVTEKGGAITNDCDACHTFYNPVKAESGQNAYVRGGSFNHPYELDEYHATLRCDQCHSGGITPPNTCNGCHAPINPFRNGKLAGFESLELPADSMVDLVDCEGCHDMSEPQELASIDEMCMMCHDDEEEKYTGMLEGWKREVDSLMLEASRRATSVRDRELIQALQSAGPLHNIEATRAITKSLGVVAAGGPSHETEENE